MNITENNLVNYLHYDLIASQLFDIAYAVIALYQCHHLLMGDIPETFKREDDCRIR